VSDVELHLHFDGNKTIVETRQDVEDIIERNKTLQNIPQKSDWGRHVASIPNNILNKWLIEEWERGNFIRAFGPEMDQLIERKLKDPDWRYLRTDSAHVQGFLGFGS
jgi:hypothetical protein